MTTDTSRPVGGLEYFERTLARAMVIVGTAFWVVAAFAGHYVSRSANFGVEIYNAMWPFLGTLATLVIGWYNERLASMLLFVAAAAIIVWGVIYAWAAGPWLIMVCAVIGPMAIAGTLFALAARARARRSVAGEDEGGTLP